MRIRVGMSALVLSVIMIVGTISAGGLASNVVEIDQKGKRLALDWDNGTKKSVWWTEKTKFSVLETGKAAKAQDVRVGSYLRIEGDEKDGKFWATDIVIWQEQSKPAPK